MQVWDINTGKLRNDLSYQSNDEYMMHDKPVLCLCLSRDGVALASGAPLSHHARLHACVPDRRWLLQPRCSYHCTCDSALA